MAPTLRSRAARTPRTVKLRRWTAVCGAVAGLGLLLSALAAGSSVAEPAEGKKTRRQQAQAPNVLLVTIDTLRTDRLSVYGYERPTSPHLDRLLERGARYTQARTVEPLTNPALSSMITARFPHEHGGTRNGLRMRPGLESLPKILGEQGWKTAAFVGNWTLRDRVSGLGEHFETYREVLNKKRWFGLFKGEADARDLTDQALQWLETYGGRRRPFLLWVHYVEPHAPYVFHEDFAETLGLPGDPDKSDRYDTEVAFCDQQVGRLLAAVQADPQLDERTLVVFASDHGESLGEHGYWGHGRNLHEPNLHIPLGFTWPGKIPPAVVETPALLLDVAPTVLGLLEQPVPEIFHGFDWSGVLTGEEDAPADRITWFQAHKGAVLTREEAENARIEGLLEVGLLAAGVKEILEVPGEDVRRYDLAVDPGELTNLATGEGTNHGGPLPSAELTAWWEQVRAGLEGAGNYPPPALDDEAVKQLEALGYGR